VIRPSFTLGGTGAAMYIKKILMSFNSRFEASPFMILIDKALMGWKEYEWNLRDKNDNVVIICSIENMDPMGFILEMIRLRQQ
jgi:carbamoylphosphate synthase large subunit